MLQIKNTLGGGKPEGMYVWKKHEIASELQELNKSVSTLPYSFFGGCAVVLNGEIHILGSNESSCYTKHYKWNGTSWVSVSTLPYNFRFGSAVVLDGEIHILGSADNASTYKYHYKWNGSSWASVSTLPVYLYYGSAVVLNGEIHILGCQEQSLRKIHYKFDGSSWTSVSTLPYDFYKGSAVVLDGEIHILGSGASGNYTNHYRWDGSSWTNVSTLPYVFYQGCAVIFDNEIHILGGPNSSYYTAHYKFDGSSWSSVGVLPYNFSGGSAVVYDNKINILGSVDSDYYTAHYLTIGYVDVYTFLDYIVSDKETAYPDGGEKGGYYYEKVSEGITPEMFGCTKMAVDTLILTAATQLSAYTVNHSLGEIPKVILVMSEIAPTVAWRLNRCLCDNSNQSTRVGCTASYYNNGFVTNNSNYVNSITNSSFIIDSQILVFDANVKYNIITMV